MEQEDFVYNKHVFPKVHMRKHSGTGYEFRTMMRKQHEGKWYMFQCMRNIAPGLTRDQLMEVMLQFIDECYKIQLFHQVDPKVMSCETQEAIYIFDSDQDSEEERMKKVIIDEQQRLGQ